MADVDMTDAPAAAPAAKKKVVADPDGKADGKKRFEVKKVWNTNPRAELLNGYNLTLCLVECCGSLGLGHRR
jgi:hypothetical protein